MMSTDVSLPSPFVVQTTPEAILILDVHNPANTLTVASIDDLLHLAWQIRQAATTSNLHITTHQALQRAARRGIAVRADTIGTICRRGQMPGAVRCGGRWSFPLWAFEEWLVTYVRR